MAEVVLPDSLINLGTGVFANMKQLNTVTVGRQVPAGALTEAFVGDGSLLEFKADDSVANYSVADGVLFNKDKTQLVAFPAAKKTAGGVYTVPETVKDIEASAFSGAQVSKVNMPKGLASIGKNGFARRGVDLRRAPRRFRGHGRAGVHELLVADVRQHRRRGRGAAARVLEVRVAFHRELALRPEQADEDRRARLLGRGGQLLLERRRFRIRCRNGLR